MSVVIDLNTVLALLAILTSLGTMVGVFIKVEHRFTKLETMQGLMTKILLDDINKKRLDKNES